MVNNKISAAINPLSHSSGIFQRNHANMLLSILFNPPQRWGKSKSSLCFPYKLMQRPHFKQTMWIIRTEHKRRSHPFLFLPFQTMSRSFCFHRPWSLKLSGYIKRSGSALPAGDWLRTLNPLVGKTSFSSRTVNLGSAQILLRSHICLSNYHTPSGKERDIALNHWCLHYSVYILIRHTKLLDF